LIVSIIWAEFISDGVDVVDIGEEVVAVACVLCKLVVVAEKENGDCDC